MKTTIQWLKEYLEKKILPCNEDNEYVYGMNVAHNNLIEYMIPYLLEKEKEQIIEAYLQGSFDDGPDSNNAEQYYNQTYHEEDDWGGLSNEELIGDDEIPKF